jgi:ABC-2 type transport system permease protein
MSKLRAVIRHEYTTIVKQPSFWIMMLALPILFAVVFLLIFISDKASTDRLDTLAKDIKNVAVIDESGFVPVEIVKVGGQQSRPVAELPALKKEVADGKLSGLIYYPKDLEQSKKYEVYVNGTDFSRVQTMQQLAGTLLKTSLFAPLGSADVISLAENGGSSTLVTYEDGQESPGFNKYIIPGVFAVAFYLILFFSVGYILTSISEEKENRSMEMALTYLKPRLLILGKLIGVILVTLTQLAFMGVLAAIALLILTQTNAFTVQLPAGIDFTKLVFDPLAIFFGLGFLISGFMLFAGLMAITAAALPARQANAFSAVFYLAGFAPFYMIQLIMTDATNPVTTFVTFFPLTSPIVALVRNTVGNMSVLESSLALATMTAFMLLAVWLAVKIFPKGALEYQNPISFKSLFRS